jgi:hypothetical protein
LNPFRSLANFNFPVIAGSPLAVIAGRGIPSLTGMPHHLGHAKSPQLPRDRVLLLGDYRQHVAFCWKERNERDSKNLWC